jgi:hypothetical protein
MYLGYAIHALVFRRCMLKYLEVCLPQILKWSRKKKEKKQI